MKLRIIAVFLLVVFAGCIVQQPVKTDFETTEPISAVDRLERNASTPIEPTTPTTKYDVDTYHIENVTHTKMNNKRKAKGVSELEYSRELSSIARYKSWDMAQNNYFNHTSADGRPYQELREEYDSTCDYYAQNIYMFKYEESKSVKSYHLKNSSFISDMAVNSLMNSTGHRKNILNPNYQVEGIGVFVDENGTVYVTQEFCGYS